MMNRFWSFFGWAWKRKLFFLVILASTVLFFVMYFPFSDLSDVVTSKVSQMTQGSVYPQFDRLDLHLLPQPAISVTNLSIETALPPLQAKWAKLTPSLFSLLFAAPSLYKASSGDPEATKVVLSKIGATLSAEGLLGGDVDVHLRPGSKGEQGRERSRISLSLDKVSLAEVQKWSELSLKMQGQLSADTDLQLTFDFQEQPDGEYNVRIKRFVLPAGTIMVPFNGAVMPVNIPTLTLANVALKGRLVGGRLFIEEGSFGDQKDPIFGRIKGNLVLRLLPSAGGAPTPMFGPYDLTFELTTTQLIEKELGIAFIMFGPGKSVTPGGGAHYQIHMAGQGLGMEYVPNITRATSF